MAELIEKECDGKKTEAVFQFLSRNERLGNQMATPEEYLQEIANELKVWFQKDCGAARQRNTTDDMEVQYPELMAAISQKAEIFKSTNHGFRRIFCIPTFGVGLVMASRIRKHYTHSRWYNIQSLLGMVGVHGTVSDTTDINRTKLTEMPQFISEFLIESIEFLERIANEQKPPMEAAEIERKRMELMSPNADKEAVKQDLEAMEEAFQGRGRVESWSPSILEKIDGCFLKHYTKGPKGDEIDESLFFPDNANNLNIFTKYCSEVDDVLHRATEGVPRYAQEYFAYYTIWEKRGYAFPVPLGTRSVVEVLHRMTERVEKGFSEVSTYSEFGQIGGHWAKNAHTSQRLEVHDSHGVTDGGPAHTRLRPVILVSFSLPFALTWTCHVSGRLLDGVLRLLGKRTQLEGVRMQRPIRFDGERNAQGSTFEIESSRVTQKGASLVISVAHLRR